MINLTGQISGSAFFDDKNNLDEKMDGAAGRKMCAKEGKRQK
jgi:hypothetical protein